MEQCVGGLNKSTNFISEKPVEVTFSSNNNNLCQPPEGGYRSKRNKPLMVISRLNVTRKPFSGGLYMENIVELLDFKINCSQLGDLMGNARGNKPPTEAKIKKLYEILGRKYGELSESMKNTAHEILTKELLYDPKQPSASIQTDLIDIYAYEMYGKGKVPKGNESPLQFEKGTLVEPEAIKFLSKIDGVPYEKNEKLFSNKWFKGIPDILVKNEGGSIQKIIEIKCSYDLPSFIASVMKKQEPADNLLEVMGYMDLTGCKNAEIVHVLLDMPDKIQNFEEKRLRERYRVFEIDEETVSLRIDQRLNDMEYSNIPTELKYFRLPVTLNKLTMKAVKSRVTHSKGWFQNIHNKFTKNHVILPQTEDNNKDD